MADDPRNVATGEWEEGGSEANPDSDHTAPADRDLLFGRLAVLNGFVDKKTLAAAIGRTDATKPLDQILVASGALTEDIRRAIETLVEQHIAESDDDPQENLSAFAQTVCGVDLSSSQTVMPPQSQHDVTPSSKVFGDYELLEEIAKGGMGVVYKARDNKLNRIVALKMIRAGEFADDDQVKRFHSEAEAAAGLDHAGIVPVFEVGEAHSQYFFSMAFIEGESIHAKVAAAGPVSAKEAALLIRKVAEAVEFAHDKGIVHRDIRPHNVLLDENSEPRVTDFGLAKQLHGGSELTATGQVMGTPSYMSPEQAAGRIEEVGVASDVYSLGATLYYLLTSRPPFQTASMMEAVRQVIDAEPAPLRRLNSDVPRDLETICLKCLRKESSKRYATAAELAHDLSRWLENKPITARPVSQAEKAWLWCKRRPAVASLLVALVFLAVVGTFVVKQREYQQEAGALVDRLITADTEDVPKLVAEMKPHWDAVAPLLQQAETEAAKGSDLKKLLHIRLALVRTNPSHVDYLFDRLLAAKVDEVPVIVELLSHWLDELEEQLWKFIETGNSGQRIRAAAALAAYNSENDQWKQNAEDVVTALVSVPSSESDEWTSMLRPVGSTLVDVLEQRFRDRSSVRDAERPLVAAALADYSPTKPLLLKELILLADNEREFQPLLMVLRNHKQLVVPELNSLLGQSAPEEVEPEQRDALLKKQANAAVCLLALGKPDSVWPLFRQRSDPSLRSFLIDRVARLGVNHEVLASRIKQESDPASRYALVLAMGQFDLGKLSSQRKRSVVQQFVALSRDTRDPGIHSAAGWALRNWQQHQVVEQIDKELAIAAHVEGQHWFVNSQGQTFAVVDGPVEFSMGEKTETAAPTLVTISHRFAVATHEVTVAQFQRFRSDHEHDAKFARKLDCPVNMVSWFDAVTYCNWLSQQDGILHDQWCYEPNVQGNYAIGMKIPADFLERTGYRLPTREEWEFVCRGGTTSNYGFGKPLELVTKYA